MKRIGLIIGSLALVALLGIAMVSRSAVDAQDSAPPATSGTPAAGAPSESTGESAKETYLAALAEKLGVTPEQLQTAIDETNAELGIDGESRGMGGPRDSHRGNDNGRPNHGNREGSSFLRGIALADAATFLGITEDELRTELATSAFLTVAEAHGKTIEDVRAFLIQQATEQIDERLQEAETAPASDSATEPAQEGTSISEATEVPAAPALTPTATS